MKSKLVSLFAGLLMAAITVLGTTLSPEAAQAATIKRLIFASAGFHESNRFWTISRPDHLQFEPFWETLLGIDPKTGEYIPGLATKWEISPDFKQWTFHLRQGVQFHHGYGEFTSQERCACPLAADTQGFNGDARSVLADRRKNRDP